MTDPPFVRDLAVTIVIFGVAAFAWFGWAQEAPPARWRVALAAGSGLGLLLALVGGLLTWQHWGPESALATAEARRTFGIVCGIEFGLAGLGAGLLGFAGRPQWIATWIAFVVGVHFIPLAFIFGDPGLLGLAALMVVAAGLSVVVHRRTGITPSALAGPGTGAALLIYAVRATALVTVF
ncbi:MAG TPA: hypothetical protein VEZ42_09580 [Pseudonocardia sp.]|nr:hypothetical protein [Pseudonocardia sp.]